MTAPTHLARGKSAESTDLLIRRRYRLVTELATPKGGVLLDFGSGTGTQTILFAPHFDRILAADVEASSLNTLVTLARQAGLAERILPVPYDGRALPIDDSSVDYVISFEVLEHVADETRSLRELHRVMKPGAVLAISVPNRWWVFETHGAALPLFKWNRVPFFSWLPKPLHDRWARARIYSRREIVRKLGAAGFRVEFSLYITAPMDVVKNPAVQGMLRRVIFRGDRTALPILSTAVLVICRRA
jgi:SAM-dependent methyltransferase